MPQELWKIFNIPVFLHHIKAMKACIFIPHLWEHRIEEKMLHLYFLPRSDTEKITTTTHQKCVYTTKMELYHVYIHKLFFVFLFRLLWQNGICRITSIKLRLTVVFGVHYFISIPRRLWYIAMKFWKELSISQSLKK